MPNNPQPAARLEVLQTMARYRLGTFDSVAQRDFAEFPVTSLPVVTRLAEAPVPPVAGSTSWPATRKLVQVWS